MLVPRSGCLSCVILSGHFPQTIWAYTSDLGRLVISLCCPTSVVRDLMSRSPCATSSLSENVGSGTQTEQRSASCATHELATTGKERLAKRIVPSEFTQARRRREVQGWKEPNRTSIHGGSLPSPCCVEETTGTSHSMARSTAIRTICSVLRARDAPFGRNSCPSSCDCSLVSSLDPSGDPT